MEKKKEAEKRRRLSAADLAKTALFTALMVAGAFLRIPFPFMPLTFQTVICALAGMVLGWRLGALSMLAYMLMGLIGIPVFSGGGGLFYVIKPSFGYILGFVLGALSAGLVRGSGNSLPRFLLAAMAAFLIDYFVGIVYFIFVWIAMGYGGLGAAIVSYNLIYMPKDIVLCLLAGLLAYKLTPLLSKNK